MGWKRWVVALAIAWGVCAGAAWTKAEQTIRVALSGGDYTTIQAAVNAAAVEGAVIEIAPGTYREVVHVGKPRIEFRGRGKDPKDVVLV